MQGIALRGHGDEKKSGNLWNLLWIIGHYNADINSYMTSQSSIRFLFLEIQNEMLTILSLDGVTKNNFYCKTEISNFLLL